MTRIGRLAAIAALAAAVAAGAGVSSTTPRASAQASCDGVWVVVDAAVTGGPVTTGCAPGSPETGLAALRGAGHDYTLVAGQPFVCRIDGRPANDPCQRFPSADAYWSYWHAEPGGTWQFSNEGAGTRTPPPGSVEGWAFGAGDEPSIPPPAPPPDPEPSPSASPSPSPSSSPSPTTAPRSEATPNATATPAPTEPDRGAATEDALHDDGADPEAIGTATPAAESDTIDGLDGRAAPEATPDPSSAASARTGGLQALVGVLLILAIVAGARIVRARRQPNHPEAGA